MTGQRHHTTDTEAVALFHDVKSLQAAIDELLTSGFDQGDLSVLGSEKAIEDKLGHSYGSTRDLEDNPNVPRATYVAAESIACGGRLHRYACLFERDHWESWWCCLGRHAAWRRGDSGRRWWCRSHGRYGARWDCWTRARQAFERTPQSWRLASMGEDARR